MQNVLKIDFHEDACHWRFQTWPPINLGRHSGVTWLSCWNHLTKVFLNYSELDPSSHFYLIHVAWEHTLGFSFKSFRAGSNEAHKAKNI